jgi:hypothetical protein
MGYNGWYGGNTMNELEQTEIDVIKELNWNINKMKNSDWKGVRMIAKYKLLLKNLVNDCMVNDFNDSWESFKEAEKATKGK